MKIINNIWRIIISVFGFLVVWIFLPVFSIIGYIIKLLVKFQRDCKWEKLMQDSLKDLNLNLMKVNGSM